MKPKNSIQNWCQFSVALLFAAVVLCGCNRGSGEKKVILKLGHVVNENDIWHKSCQHFAEEVKKRTQGRVEVKVFPSEQLGKELEMIRSIKSGIMDMTVSGESMQNWTPHAAFCGMPYLIEDLEHAKAVLASSEGEKIVEQIKSKVGLVPVGYFVRGPRHLTSNRPVKSPDDLNNLILRVPNVPISVATWKALGAKPTPMSFSEVFTALQSGTVEAQENPFALIKSAGFHEVQKYVNLTQHVVGWVYLMIGEKQLESLSPEDRQAVLDAGQAMQEFHQQLFVEEEKNLRSLLEKNGMEMIEVDWAAFREKSSAAILDAIPDEIRPMYQRIKELKVAN